MTLRVIVDDLTSLEVQNLVAAHLAAMHGNSPPGQANALAIDDLRAPAITFWAARIDGQLCGCGALKELNPTTGEIKSMHTLRSFQRKGIAQAVLDAIQQEASNRGYRQLVLETGTGPAFESAHAFYEKNGFRRCEAFAEYAATDFSAFFGRSL